MPGQSVLAESRVAVSEKKVLDLGLCVYGLGLASLKRLWIPQKGKDLEHTEY